MKKRNQNQVVEVIAPTAPKTAKKPAKVEVIPPKPQPKPIGQLCAHVNSTRISLDDLANIPTPAGTKTWSPVPHIQVVRTLQEALAEAGFEAPEDRIQVAANPNGSRMFGVLDVLHKDLNALGGDEFAIAMGFRNSHDKTMAFRLTAGTRVFVCDNMAMTGEIQYKREHTVHIDIRKTAEIAIRAFMEQTPKEIEWFSSLQKIALNKEKAMAFLLSAVDSGALPIMQLMDARKDYLMALDENPEAKIHHPGTLWAGYQAVSARFKDLSLLQLRDRSASLREVANAYLN